MPRTDSLDLDALADFDARQDVRDAERQAQARAQGVTVCACMVCGKKRSLNWLGYGCNEATGQDVCEGEYRAVMPVRIEVLA